MAATDHPVAQLCDQRLLRLLAAEESEVDREIERILVDEVHPVMTSILDRYARSRTLLTTADAEDLGAAIDLRILEALRALHATQQNAIHDLRGYVATLTYNSISDFLRARFPERARLKNRVRYALAHDERLALWNAGRGPAGGLKLWEGETQALEDVPMDIAIGAPVAGESHGDALVQIFDGARRPVLVEALVNFLQNAWDVSDAAVEAPLTTDIACDDPDAAQRLEGADFARALWREVCELRPLQRKALLLNLRYDGDLDLIAILLLSRIATMRDLAHALELSERELVAIWKQLPFDDLRIAELLNVTRQQVINLRKAARARLSRRLPR